MPWPPPPAIDNLLLDHNNNHLLNHDDAPVRQPPPQKHFSDLPHFNDVRKHWPPPPPPPPPPAHLQNQNHSYFHHLPNDRSALPPPPPPPPPPLQLKRRHHPSSSAQSLPQRRFDALSEPLLADLQLGSRWSSVVTNTLHAFMLEHSKAGIKGSENRNGTHASPSALLPSAYVQYDPRNAAVAHKWMRDHGIAPKRFGVSVDLDSLLRADGSPSSARMDANAARGHYRTLRTDQNHEIAAEKIDAGDSYTTAGLYPKAIEQYNTALGLDPRSADAYVGRGTALYHLDKLEEAARDFRTALRVEEQHPKAGGFLETVLSRLRARKVEVESAYRGEYLMPMEDDSSSNTKRGGPKSTVGGGGFYDTMSVSERVHVHGDEAMERERERERERENERGGGKSKKEKSSKKKSGKRKKKKKSRKERRGSETASEDNTRDRSDESDSGSSEHSDSTHRARRHKASNNNSNSKHKRRRM